MTITTERPPEVEAPPPERPDLRGPAAAWLASSAAMWMAAGVFRGFEPRVVALLGVTIGAGAVALSVRTRRPALVQWLAVPAAAVAGAVLTMPDTGGGLDLVALVRRALSQGGLADPPVPFDPGWRFLLVVGGAALGSASAGLAAALGRPRLGLAAPLPVLVLAATLQPSGGALASGTVAAALMFAALAIQYGGELAADGQATRGFEVRRLARGGVVLAVLCAGVVLLGRAAVLFPESERPVVIPPQRPPDPAPLNDRVLFTVRTAEPGPWRLGVLDVYDGRGWLFPPFDTGRLEPVRPSGVIADPVLAVTPERVLTARFTIEGLEGQTLPSLATPLAVRTSGLEPTYDPRTQSIRAPAVRLAPGMTYEVDAPATASGTALQDAPERPGWTEEFVEAPSPPGAVTRLLRDAPENAWDRLQSVRAALYASVSAAGAGVPADVPPGRVVDLLRGGEGTPWEITAAEALLARWAGVPARIGYGFYRGDRDGDTVTVRPRHGATWLEVYFEGHGWVPVVGTPPRARSTLTPEQTNPTENVRPTDELALVVHVPVRLRTVRLLYVVARYWAAVAAAVIASVALLWWSAPGFAKLLRRASRARWARERGARGRIAVAYAGMRDRATDLGLGSPTSSPLAFLDDVAPDDEHTELAWLVTRALWGDLTRDLRDEDAEAAEELARSVGRRIARAQPGWARLASFGSRRSLREPAFPELPGIRVRAALRAAGVTALALAVACGSGAAPSREPALPERVAPERVEGYRIRREPRAERAYRRAGPESLVAEGRVYTVRRAGSIEGYLQAAAFVSEVDVGDRDVRTQVLGSIGTGRFSLERIGEDRVWVQELPEQRMLLWFTPDGGAMFLLVARRGFADAGRVFSAIVSHVEGEAPGPAAPGRLYDPRRGGEA